MQLITFTLLSKNLAPVKVYQFLSSLILLNEIDQINVYTCITNVLGK